MDDSMCNYVKSNKRDGVASLVGGPGTARSRTESWKTKKLRRGVDSRWLTFLLRLASRLRAPRPAAVPVRALRSYPRA